MSDEHPPEDLRPDIDEPLSKRDAVLLIGSLLNLTTISANATANSVGGDPQEANNQLKKVLSGVEDLKTRLIELAYGKSGGN